MGERRFEFVRENGVMRLPPGFRFQPTDEELVFQYLKCKIFSCPLPATVIPHINICRYDPWDLPAGNMEQERYFFFFFEQQILLKAKSQRTNEQQPKEEEGPRKPNKKSSANSKNKAPETEKNRTHTRQQKTANRTATRAKQGNNEAKYRNGNRINRTAASGYWKATGVDRQIVSSSSRNNNNNNQMVGMKKTLVFYRGKPPHESRTDWIMHEYRLVNAAGTTPSNSNLMENWVICRIFLKKRSMREDADHNGVVSDQPSRFHDFMTRNNSIRLSPEISSCSSSSSSSGTYQ